MRFAVHWPGKVPQGLLLHHLRAWAEPVMCGPRLGELSALFQVAWRACPTGPPVRLLLDREVPYEPGMSAMFAQYCRLGGRRCQAVTGHSNILSRSADIPEEVKRRFLPGLGARVYTS